MSIWKQCKGLEYFIDLELEPWRIVEDQFSSSSRDLVESSDEHELLEQMLDDCKPQVEAQSHYLIYTPFRYPPLKYGSRFGSAYEPSLWYGSFNLETAFAEVAFYRLQFFQDTSANLGFIEIRMTAFKVFIKTHHGIDLTKPPFDKFHQEISCKNYYSHSQLLGSEMREAEVEAFVFISARDKKAGCNLGVYTHKVFKPKKNQYISSMQNWRCMSNINLIEFSRDDIVQSQRFEFSRAAFDN